MRAVTAQAVANLPCSLDFSGSCMCVSKVIKHVEQSEQEAKLM